MSYNQRRQKKIENKLKKLVTRIKKGSIFAPAKGKTQVNKLAKFIVILIVCSVKKLLKIS